MGKRVLCFSKSVFLYFIISLLCTVLLSTPSLGMTNPWAEGIPVPENGFANPYEMNSDELYSSRQRGAYHILNYPVEVTGISIPLKLIQLVDDYLEQFPLLSKLPFVQTMDAWEAWLGLKPYDRYKPIHPSWLFDNLHKSPAEKLGFRVGTTVIQTPNGSGVTFSCVSCHAETIFGKQVIGLSKRFPKAHEFNQIGKTLMKLPLSEIMSAYPFIDRSLVNYLKEVQTNTQFVETVNPIVSGLDTSLSLVGLSLTRRAEDPFASKVKGASRNVRYSPLREKRADSKVMPLWNTRYKNRFLSDASIVSGNPIATNILWNEIGRGTDLKQLDQWSDENSGIIRDMTNFVYGLEPPKYADFFPERPIQVTKAKRGQVLYNNNCARCHGWYKKGWELGDQVEMSYRERIATTSYKPLPQTIAMNVGTDLSRAYGIKHLLPLNQLAFSKKHDVVIKPTKGYSPPPLQGIWSRWPYMHNNSIPNLCTLFEHPSNRPNMYYMGPALDSNTDYDHYCLGYPIDNVPEQWKGNKENVFDTRKPGLSNQGHAEGIIFVNGQPVFSPTEISDLLEFLKTL